MRSAILLVPTLLACARGADADPYKVALDKARAVEDAYKAAITDLLKLGELPPDTRKVAESRLNLLKASAIEKP